MKNKVSIREVVATKIIIAILIAGYPSAEISMKWLKEGIKGK